MANDLLRIDSLIQALSEVTTVITAAREFGNYRRDTCLYQKEALCTLHPWSSEGEIPAGIGSGVCGGTGGKVGVIGSPPSGDGGGDGISVGLAQAARIRKR